MGAKTNGGLVILAIPLLLAACEVISGGECDPAATQNCVCTDPNDSTTCKLVTSDADATSDATADGEETSSDVTGADEGDTTPTALDCPAYWSCADACGDTLCEDECYENATEDARSLYDDVMMCADSQGCFDGADPNDCIATSCAFEVAACEGTAVSCDPACVDGEVCQDGNCIPDTPAGPTCSTVEDCGGASVAECASGTCVGDRATTCSSLCGKLYECDGCLDCTADCIADCEAGTPEWDPTQADCIVAANDCVELNACFRAQPGCDDYCAAQATCFRSAPSDRCARACKAGNLSLDDTCWAGSCGSAGCLDCTNACLVLAECGEGSRLSGRALQDCWESCDMDGWSDTYMTCLIEAADCAAAVACTP